ncbi:RES family NAD+ phosphorylase [Halobacteriovorax sp. DA5]|uniref:RES family NAD+ phosphorylase n=1 Tax=Halobacteriovorax sp. DA5 TaxID=2067553 RepID=UPI000CD23036|nr:RES family NAD+ phosphorylase [Halobacteriovorax sp. DA5]POB13630.1 hypothetical protein C0Z22_10725 [Halobacteriovorax sp. DA5]
MPKRLREFDRFLQRNKRSKAARDAILRRAIPEYFVDEKLRQFEEYNEKERAYSDTVENYLQREREKRIDDINDVFLKHIKTDYKYDNLSRIVRAKFHRDPLCCIGSVKRPPGGRFNFGQTTRITTNYFQALYLANDYDTAFAECFHSEDESIGDFAHFKVTAKIDRYLDLRDKNVIGDFFKVIKDIKLPNEYIELAKQLGVEPMSLCLKETELYNAIFSERYKAWDTWVDQYAPSQWFGYYVYDLGIPAIVYPSVRDAKGFNLAVYTENFEDTDNEIKLSSSLDWSQVSQERSYIDSNNFADIQKQVILD